jgi:simple sugar transport system permease protein
VAATALSWDLPLVVALAVGVAFLVRNTSFGFNLRATGENEPAARAAGIRTKRITVLALLLSGAFAGLAGSSLILGGEAGNMADNFSAGYGFEGIVVALLARNSALASIPAALVLAALRQGGGLMEARVGVPSALVGITQGVIIIAIAGAAFLAERAARPAVVVTPPADDAVPANA